MAPAARTACSFLEKSVPWTVNQYITICQSLRLLLAGEVDTRCPSQVIIHSAIIGELCARREKKKVGIMGIHGHSLARGPILALADMKIHGGISAVGAPSRYPDRSSCEVDVLNRQEVPATSATVPLARTWPTQRSCCVMPDPSHSHAKTTRRRQARGTQRKRHRFSGADGWSRHAYAIGLCGGVPGRWDSA